MRVVESVSEMHLVRGRLDAPVSLVATLGAIHSGHEVLLERARVEGASLVASLFLNPTQFEDPSDLRGYPRDTSRDLATFERMGVDVVFKPSVEEMYPPGHTIVVDPGPLGSMLEGTHRPGHFRGIATVVAKILYVVRPDLAVWGAKDAQQNLVIRQVSRDLCMNVEHVIVPTVRDGDGLAFSSRNRRLSVDERRAATVLFAALSESKELWAGGERCAHVLRDRIREFVGREPLVHLEYVSVADPEALTELDALVPGALLSVAAHVGSVRLIDNVVLE